MGEVRNRGVSPSPKGLKLLQEMMVRKVWSAADVATHVVASGLCESMDDRTVDRFLQKDPKNKKVEKLNAQAVCSVLELEYSDIVECEEVGGQLKTDKTNPFNYGPLVSADQFYGRHREQGFIRDCLSKNNSVSLVGLRRSGKTSLLKYLVERQTEFSASEENLAVVLLDLSDGTCQTHEKIVESLRRGLTNTTGREPWRREDNMDPFAFEDGLIGVRDRGFRVVVLLDEFEAIGRRVGEFEDWGNDWRSKASTSQLFTLVTASQRSLADFYKEHRATSPFGNIFNQIDIGPMPNTEWQGLVQKDFADVSPELLAWIDSIAGGLPYYVQLAAASIWASGGDLEIARKTFIAQGEEQFQILWRDFERERSALSFVAGFGGVEPNPSMTNRLLRYGLLRRDGELFSSAFSEWIRDYAGAV
jgi:hypothetical protein